MQWRSAIKKMSIVPNHQEPERSIVKNTDINNIQSVNNFKYSIVIDNQSSQYAIGNRFVHIESYNTIPARATSLLCPSLVARRYTAEQAATATAHVKQPRQGLVGKFQWYRQRPQHNIQLQVSRSVRRTIDLDQVAIVEHENAYRC